MSTATTLSAIIREEAKRYHAFINLAFLLAFLTSTEIVIIFLPFAKWLVISSLVVLSSVKFFCVILWFMHLIYDKLFLFLVFMAGILIALGTVLALMFLFSPADLDPAYYSSLSVFSTLRVFA
jgi:cytochrome c oxidase subunit 4